MNRRYLPPALLLVTQLIAVAFVTHLAAAARAPLRIDGGTFEASGVAHVPGTHSVLFVDDGRNREVFWMELNPDGTQQSRVQSIPLGADITDLEGITTDGTSFYVVGSQSKTTGFEGDGLARFRFNVESKRIERLERIQGLKRWLAEHVAELRGTGEKVGDSVLNIEGIAWDPQHQRLLLGLRAPVIEGQALIIPITLRQPSGPFTLDNLSVDHGKAMQIDLDGAGIRSIEYDDHARAFRIITGAGLNKENRDFRILEWTGSGGGVRELARYQRQLKPEGITTAIVDGKPRTVVVFDTSRFAMLD